MTQAKSRRDASVSILRAPRYISSEMPPLPPSVRLAARCWERIWNLTLSQDPDIQSEHIKIFFQRFNTDSVTVRGFMRSNRKLGFAITGGNTGEQADFELAMRIMARVEQEFGLLDRVEDRPAQVWPYRAFSSF